MLINFTLFYGSFLQKNRQLHLHKIDVKTILMEMKMHVVMFGDSLQIQFFW